MPFKSKAQQRYMFAAEARHELPKGTAERWAHHTPDIKSLPQHVKKKNKRSKRASVAPGEDVFAELSDVFGQMLISPGGQAPRLESLPPTSNLRRILKAGAFAFGSSEANSGGQAAVARLSHGAIIDAVARQQYTNGVAAKGLTSKDAMLNQQNFSGLPTQNPPNGQMPPGNSVPLPATMPMQNNHPQGGWAGAGMGSASALGPSITRSKLGNGPGASGFQGKTQGVKVGSAGEDSRGKARRGLAGTDRQGTVSDAVAGLGKAGEASHDRGPAGRGTAGEDSPAAAGQGLAGSDSRAGAWLGMAGTTWHLPLPKLANDGSGLAPLLGMTALGAAGAAGSGIVPGAAAGGLLGLGAGAARGNTPEGVGRGLVRGGMTGAGAGLGSFLSPIALLALSQATGQEISPMLLAGAAGAGGLAGGYAGFRGSGALLGPAAGRAKQSSWCRHQESTKAGSSLNIPMPSLPSAPKPAAPKPAAAPKGIFAMASNKDKAVLEKPA